MQYHADLLPIAQRIVAVADTVPRAPIQWSHVADYDEPKEIVPCLYLARILVQFHGNERLVRAAIKAFAHDRGADFGDEVRSLHDLTWALDDALAALGLVDLQALVGFLSSYLERLEHDLEECDEIEEEEEDADEEDSDED